MSVASSVFGPRERASLLAIAEAALPAGHVFPGASERTIDRVEEFLGQQSSSAQRAYRALVGMVDGAALLSRGRTMTSLGVDQRLALLESWRAGGVVRRNALRALMVPLKFAHFEDPVFYQQLGCAFERLRPAPEPKPAWWRDRVHPAATLDADQSLACDVVVIGTGAGGAVVAKELAEAGVAVVMIEEGDYFERKDFADRPFAMQRKLYRAAGATFSIGNVTIPIPLGKTVGGTTTINSGTCFRTPDAVLRRWRDDHGLADLSPEAMGPYFERVERVLQPGPTPPEHLGGCAQVVIRGADRLGYSHRPLRRNAPACDGQGVCCFGCPTDAKRSTNVSYVPMALRAGAELYTGARVTRLVFDRGRAVGVVARSSGGRTLTVHAPAVVVACGSLLTPVLLMRNQVADRSGQLGRNLSIHPALGLLGEMEERVESWKGVPQSYSIDEFADQGILMEGAATPLEYTASEMSQIGPRLIELAEGYDRVASFGFMVSDTSRGSVRLVRGRPVVTYNLGDPDVARIKRGAELLARVFFAAGARSVITPVHGFDELRGPADVDRLARARLRAADFSLSAYHPLGTARMGRDPASSVIGPDHQVHGAPGLYVVDGAAVPTALGVNPQVTIMALATRAADLLAARLS
ncbi:MAG TPA: GMC family oxidoreductase [Kofleriaceae bacterium]|nr:GMC family oxidoreductase [Kofleriaceae bacterium]